jgi:hypothetical protein
MKRAIGNWVEGESFWDREDELRDLIERLEEGQHILIIATRRIGKTSLMREAGRRMAGRFHCLQVDLENAQCAEDAIAELSAATWQHASLWRKTKTIFSGAFDKVVDRVEALKAGELTITLRSSLNEDNWRGKGDDLFQALGESEEPVVVFFDEVPILVNRLLKGPDFRITPERRREADAFMSWLRANSIRYGGKVRIVLTGSIGLIPVLRQAGLSATINNFAPFELEAWDAETAKGCLNELAKAYDYTFEEGVADRMVELLGYCIPHHVQLFFDNVHTGCRLQKTRGVSMKLVEDIYGTKMIGIRGHADLSHMEERLRMVLGREMNALALELLTESAVVGRLTYETAEAISRGYIFEDRSTPEALREILEILEHDGYLIGGADKGFKFRSNLLRDWWRARFGSVYVRLSERKV